MTGVGRAVVAILVLVLVGSPAFGQARDTYAFEVGGGYAFLGGAWGAEGYGAGWFADGGWRATHWLTLAGEFGQHRRRLDLGFIDVKMTVDNLVAGVRIRHRRPQYAPYVQVLVGAVRLKQTAHLAFPVVSTAAEANVYGTVQVGGGIQIPVSSRLAVRIDATYRHVFDALRPHHHRFATGAVYAFGER